MAKLSLPIGIAIISIASFILPSNTFAHSEHDKSRFVATNGIDKERCDNVLRPCKTIAYAVSQANKGDKVLVSSGEFTIGVPVSKITLNAVWRSATNIIEVFPLEDLIR